MKKGSLQLSINAIVILILAITMLGLGLGFMRSVFTSATEEFTRVGGTVQKQMIDQMKEGDKIVDLDRPKVDIKRAKDDQIFIGLRNVDIGATQFLIETHATANIGIPDSCGAITLQYIESAQVVQSGEVVVYPINVIVGSGAPEGTCFIDFVVCSAPDGTPITTCAGATPHAVELTVNTLI